ncbi:uncharacterized protein LOC122888571 isoform X4 [Siniperca chuatsi]|uniref:uncharacterized protein LOC122888571 isoform X4 n=1 Tax=Siniperca chuatsi TaxID=119488 RepID=UPI001CE1F8C1|nr:uncharacterized protein LOC122888571 isoform X4 [Siniperca chuatsi]
MPHSHQRSTKLQNWTGPQKLLNLPEDCLYCLQAKWKIRIFEQDVCTFRKIKIPCRGMSSCPNQSTTLKSDKHRASHMRSTTQSKVNCSIIENVEYDFRQQERRFLEVLNHSARGNHAFSMHLSQPLNFSLLRNVIIKNLTKSKVKSKKLCKTLFKWLPRKIQQV